MDICEMFGCEQDMTETGTVTIYGGELGRLINVCEWCLEDYENAMAYGHPDMAYQWLIKTQDELAVTN